ncbi:hypothetical protein ACL02U_09740 [Streptomyces sp. MS06]|uniref:hypothetical protein n=1 Tax=Streptomyces sp. MS06 TaxID=3385974 RepID=UPI00399FF26E
MSNEEQDTRASGSVPNAFGNVLAWTWMPNMPASLKRSNLHTLLYTLRAIANADGTLRYRDTRRPFSLQAIAKAAGADPKDARDRLEAAVRAGVVKAVGERRKGRSVLYVLAPIPAPDWAAAAAYLDGVKALREDARQKRKTERKVAPWADEKGGRSPELESTEKGGPPPELEGIDRDSERGTAPYPRKGDRPLTGWGDRPPYTPGGYPWGSHDGAEVVPQPQVVAAPEEPSDHQEHPHDTAPPPARAAPPKSDPADHTTWPTCPVCDRRIMPDPRRPDRRVHARCEPRLTAERTAS